MKYRMWSIFASITKIIRSAMHGAPTTSSTPSTPVTPVTLFSFFPIVTLLLFSFLTAPAQNPATVREYPRTFLTYPFSDPNPVAKTGKIYPYFRFDGFTTKGINQDWKIVELENDWIKVLISPEMGGKILGAIEKSTGNEFLYLNKVVKHRDISMRGAWTSGGIEFNFGSIGHAPTTATPVDYQVRQNPDGSASCWIGALELTSRTEWRVEIRVPKDKAWIETNIFWYNPTDLSTSKYHWATAAADAENDLTYYWPGDHYIGHDGEASPWPVLKDGRNISNYAENDYGSDHSYHVLGAYTDYFAGFYSTRNFGFGHWNDYPEKPGKKIWIWALSPQGALWTDLLTDQPGNMQYTEIQTGILFNQEAAGSTYTPFKHMGFPSHSCERFSEYWFPIVGTGGVTEISAAGTLFIDDSDRTADRRPRTAGGMTADSRPRTAGKEEGTGGVAVKFCPIEFIKDTMIIEYTDGTLERIPLDLKPLELFTYTIDSIDRRSAVGGQSFSVGRRSAVGGRRSEIKSVSIGTRLVYSAADQAARDSDRPVVSPQFDWNSVQGLYIKAMEFSRQREYSQARDYYRQCLAKDARYIPALTGLAEEYIRILKPRLAEELLQTALGIDTYDPKANYLYGLVKKEAGLETLREREEVKGVRGVEGVKDVKGVAGAQGTVPMSIIGIQGFYQAREAFGMALRSMEYRSAAYTQMAEIALLEMKPDQVFKYSGLAQDYNRYNIKALQLEILASRLSGDFTKAANGLARLKEMDPLNHFARFENYLLQPDEANLNSFRSMIRNEFPEQTYLELAIFYYNCNLLPEAKKILSVAPDHPEVNYWRRFLGAGGPAHQALDTSVAGKSTLTSRNSTKFVFPYRPETLSVIEWAEKNQPDWRNRYYTGLIRWNLDDSLKARELFRSCGDKPDEAHFYLGRARLFEGADDVQVAKDLERAVNLDPEQWRTWHAVTNYYVKNRLWVSALENARKGSSRIPGHMILEFDRAKTELYNHNYDDCLDVLSRLIILPAEGAREGHQVYRSALILRALDHLRHQRYIKALKDIEDARKWPATLGVGKPFVTDERIEDYLAGICYDRMKQPDMAAKYFNQVIDWTRKQKPEWGSSYLLAALSAVMLDRETEGDRILNDWMKTQPSSPLMMWAVASYTNNPSAAQKALVRLGWRPEESLWGLGDEQLALVYEVVRQVIIK